MERAFPSYDLVEMLQQRGFLLEQENGQISLSDNSHPQDLQDLDHLLRKHSIGYLSDGGVLQIIDAGKTPALRDELFQPGLQISFDVCSVEQRFQYFAWREFGEKVPVMELEPYVARYIKALSACGIMTARSCDGNHEGQGNKRIWVECSDVWNTEWHRLLWEELLNSRFHIPWDARCCKIRLDPVRRLQRYRTLNEAAEYLYENRFAFRRVKYLSCKGITNAVVKRSSRENILAMLKENFNQNKHIIK